MKWNEIAKAVSISSKHWQVPLCVQNAYKRTLSTGGVFRGTWIPAVVHKSRSHCHWVASTGCRCHSYHSWVWRRGVPQTVPPLSCGCNAAQHLTSRDGRVSRGRHRGVLEPKTGGRGNGIITDIILRHIRMYVCENKHHNTELIHPIHT